MTLSQNLIKKINYGFSKCKLTLYDSIIINNKIEYNYYNNYDFFADFFIKNNSDSNYSLAYFYFNYNGFMYEHTKKIHGLGPVFLKICTIFNIVVLIARNINNYYGTKILFSDIYLNFLINNGRLLKLTKDYDKKGKNATILHGLLNKSMRNSNIINNKGSDDNVNNIQLFNCRNDNSFKIFNLLDNSKISKIKFDYISSRNEILKFYFYPYCLIKKFKNLYQIKEQVNTIFSFENFFNVLHLSNFSRNLLYEQTSKYILNENYQKNVSKDNEISDINIKNLCGNNKEPDFQ